MGTKLGEYLADLRRQGRKLLIPYVMCGDPELGFTGELLHRLESAGADAVELGIPFSDPMADGPVIQAAAQRALRSGTNLARILELCGQLKGKLRIPLVLMGYYNPVYRYGVGRFVRECAERGVGGLIIADLPPEEAGELIDACGEYGVATVFLASPVSTPHRLRLICEKTTGYVYCVAYTGVTGDERRSLDEVREMVARLRSLTDTVIALGFGISSPEKARRAATLADAVVVGSALIRELEAAQGTHEDKLRGAYRFIASLRGALDEVGTRRAAAT